MLIPLKSFSAVVVTVSSKFMPICNRLHAIRANSRAPVFDARVRKPHWM